MNTTMLPVADESQDFRRVARAIEFIAANFREQPPLEQIAAAADLSEYHFARLFRRWAGISPKQFLQHLSVTAAQAALADDESVLQAALTAGLSGPGRLHDLFIALEAATPGEFKTQGRGLTMRFGNAATPFGPARIAVNDRGIAFLAFSDADGVAGDWDTFRSVWREAAWVEDDISAGRVAKSIWEVAPGRTERLTLWVHGTNFQMKVWQAMLDAASRRTVSYQQLALRIGQPKACRAVGGAVGANPVAWLIPCHHVLRANGALGGYRWGIERKRAMLAWEVARSVRDASRPRRDSCRVSA
jgi:AraC family transcriptional regulator, regulatory protein of adaptative response / methylated-DNA-[protein]-cysteine methyltransferase